MHEVVDLSEVEKIFLTGNKTFKEKEVIENYFELGLQNVNILKDHLTYSDLAEQVYSFFVHKDGVHFGIGKEGSPIKYVKVSLSK